MNELPSPTTQHNGSSIVITIPLQVKRRNGRKEIIAPAGVGTTNPHAMSRNDKLALTLARIFHWQQLMETGRFYSLRDLAVAIGQHPSYVAKQMKLTLLAPDIIEAIITGREPSGLSLEKLYDMPVNWDEQRQVLGFAAD